jgi:hypothetical protein
MNMKRRNFGLLAGTSLAALTFGIPKARAAVDPAIFTTTLTPMGAERAGNADGSIPAWTGGATTVPPGWTPDQFMPDPYESDAVVVKIDATNMAQYADKLSPGTMAMMTKYPDFFIAVYPTRRTAAAPQDVYDSIAQNANTAQLSPAGPQMGFTGALNGIPFPILDPDPLKAGGMLIYNHYVNWRGRALTFLSQAYAVSDGNAYLSDASPANYDYPYYHKGVTQATFDGISQRTFEQYTAPANDVGEEILTTDFTDPVQTPNEVWELLNGQGRVRKAPEVNYDTPASTVDGMADTDEFFGFAGTPDHNDYHYQGKKELYIPYNNNTLVGKPASEVVGAHFFDPNSVRWELHRVHVMEATVRPGKRNTLPRRMFYIDEDTWTIAVTDGYDANNTLVHVGFVYFICRPDLPGTFIVNNSVHILQTGDWTPMAGPYNEKAHPSIVFHDSLPDSMYDPNNMAASAQY